VKKNMQMPEPHGLILLPAFDLHLKGFFMFPAPNCCKNVQIVVSCKSRSGSRSKVKFDKKYLRKSVYRNNSLPKTFMRNQDF